MSDKYKIYDNERPYFIAMTVVGWIDIFTRKELKLIIVNSLDYCQKKKGLIVYGWCLMSNHLHIICQAEDGFFLTDILKDFKKYTSKVIIKKIEQIGESRREWLIDLFHKYCEHLKRDHEHKVWQDGNHAVVIESNKFFFEKLNYIHNNPVEEMIVQNPEDYIFSFARNYAELDNLLEVFVGST